MSSVGDIRQNHLVLAQLAFFVANANSVVIHVLRSTLTKMHISLCCFGLKLFSVVNTQFSDKESET